MVGRKAGSGVGYLRCLRVIAGYDDSCESIGRSRLTMRESTV